VREIVLNGRGAMPAVGKGWSPAELAVLIAHLRRLGAQGGG
jgi:hypothetical protein